MQSPSWWSYKSSQVMAFINFAQKYARKIKILLILRKNIHIGGLMQIMIMLFECGRAESVCNLPADIDKKGKVLKIYDYKMNELKINLDGTITYNNKRWAFEKQQSI